MRSQRPFRSTIAAPAPNVPLTSCVHRRQHDGGNPGDLAVGNRKILLDLLVVDGEGLGKGVGKAYGDESTQDHGPAPASIWWRVAQIAFCCGGHVSCQWLQGRDIEQRQHTQAMSGFNTAEIQRACCLMHGFCMSQDLTSARCWRVCFPACDRCCCAWPLLSPAEIRRSQAFDLITRGCTMNNGEQSRSKAAKFST